MERECCKVKSGEGGRIVSKIFYLFVKRFTNYNGEKKKNYRTQQRATSSQ